MKVKDLKPILHLFNSEIEFKFIVCQHDKGEGGEDIISKTYAEDWCFRLNNDTNELEIIIDL